MASRPSPRETCRTCGGEVFTGDDPRRGAWPEHDTFTQWPGHELMASTRVVGDEIIEAFRSAFRPSPQRHFAERIIRALRTPGTGNPGS